jgi:hypothetical protein
VPADGPPGPPAVPQGLVHRHPDHRQRHQLRQGPPDRRPGDDRRLGRDHISDLVWDGPLAGIRVGYIDGKLVANPTFAERKLSTMDMIVACTKDAIMMVEGEMHEVGEALIIDGMLFALEAAQPLIELQQRLREVAGKPKREFVKPVADEALFGKVKELGLEDLAKAMATKEKKKRGAAISEVHKKVAEQLTGEGQPWAGKRKDVDGAWSKLVKKHARGQTLATKKRIDGRDPTRSARSRSRSACCRGARLGAVHPRRDPGAGAVTLGTKYDEQKLDTLLGDLKQAVLPALQLPAVLDRRGQAAPRPVAARGRPRLPRRALGRAHPAAVRGLPVHDPRRVGDPRVQRQLVDGLGVRRLAGADGRRRPDHLAGGRHRDGPDEGGRRVRHPVGHPRRRGPPGRHGLQGHRHPAASARCRWTSRSTA